jgi:V/A-type H+-transporting ATPase subunit C
MRTGGEVRKAAGTLARVACDESERVMAGFDYGNARLRALKSRLLSRKELEALAESGSVKSLIVALTKTAYRKSIESALTRASGMTCIAEALREDLINTLGKIGEFYVDEAAESVAVVLRRYDIHNLKVILRGLSTNASPGEILEILVPAGELKYGILAELSRAPNPRAAIDSLASMDSPFARPLLKLRAEFPGAEVSHMELALDRWNFQEAQAYLDSAFQMDGVLPSWLKMEADLSNLLIALRFANTPGERKELREWIGVEDLSRLFVGPGELSFALLAEAGRQENLGSAVEALAGTRYALSLRQGMDGYARSGRLSELEKRLRHFCLKWESEQILNDALGIGVVIGYLALKENEVGNIRWIAQGLSLSMEAGLIRGELELLS